MAVGLLRPPVLTSNAITVPGRGRPLQACARGPLQGRTACLRPRRPLIGSSKRAAPLHAGQSSPAPPQRRGCQPPAVASIDEAETAEAAELTAGPANGAAAAPALATVLFEVHGRLPPGEGLLLVGDCLELGAGDALGGLLLDWGPGDSPDCDKWTALAVLPPGPLTFKVLRLQLDGKLVHCHTAACTLPRLSPLMSRCGSLRVALSLGTEAGAGAGAPPASQPSAPSVQLVMEDRERLQTVVSAALSRAQELTRRRNSLQRRALSLAEQVKVNEGHLRRMHAELEQRLAEGPEAAKGVPGPAGPGSAFANSAVPVGGALPLGSPAASSSGVVRVGVVRHQSQEGPAAAAAEAAAAREAVAAQVRAQLLLAGGLVRQTEAPEGVTYEFEEDGCPAAQLAEAYCLPFLPGAAHAVLQQRSAAPVPPARPAAPAPVPALGAVSPLKLGVGAAAAATAVAAGSAVRHDMKEPSPLQAATKAKSLSQQAAFPGVVLIAAAQLAWGACSLTARGLLGSLGQGRLRPKPLGLGP